MSSGVPTLQAPSGSDHSPDPGARRRWPIFLFIALLVVAGLIVVAILATGNDPAPGPIDDAPPTSGLPQPVTDTISAITDAAAASDWDGLAALALAGDEPFTASFGEEFTTVEALAAYWTGLATEEDLARILTALVALPDWHPTTTVDGDASDTMHVTPAFMHDQSDANRAALEQALGAEWLEQQMADGQYLGWRLGITADGDWRFFVQGGD